MKLRPAVFLASCFLPLVLLLPAAAQTQTAVSATVTDPSGIPYANGTFSIQLIPTGNNPNVNGAAINGAFNGSLDPTGSFSVSLWPNGSITPASTTWQFTVCSNSGGIQPPLGTGTQCTPPTAITISGTAQVLTSTLTALAPKLTNFAGAGTGTIAGTVTAFHIPFASGANTLADNLDTAVAAATGAITLTAGATTTVPLTIATPSSVQTADLLDFNTTFATPETFFDKNASLTAPKINIIAPAAPAGVSAPLGGFFIQGNTGGAPATATSNGNQGSVIFLLAGNGSVGGATSGNGGPGGDWILGGGSGGNATAGNGNGGSGGAIHWGAGIGGNGIGTGSGGNGSDVQIPIAGTGGGGNAGTSGGNGGRGGDFIIALANGGTSTTATGGRGGNFQFTAPSGGTGVTNGVPGQAIFTRGGGPTGSQTTPFINIVDTWNTTGVVDAGIFFDVQSDTSGAGSLLMDLQDTNTTKFKVDKTGITTAQKLSTLTNCAGVGTAASPSVASCASASAGHFSCATNATGATCTVNTTAVTANSEIFVFESDTAATGTALGVTCNTSTTVVPTSRLLASSIAGTSFTINLGTVTTNPACFSYLITN